MVRTSVVDGMYLRETDGQGGRPVLFVHGLGESGLCFEGLLGRPELAAWPLLVPDLPGYGRSPRTEAPLSLADQADRLGGLLRHRVGAPAVVVGHSMGGIAALLLAERHPELVAAVLDVDGNKAADDCTYSGRAAAQPLAAFVAGGFDRLRESILRDGLDDAASRGYYVSLCLADPTLFHANSVELVALSEAEALATRLAALPVPHAYVAGVPGGASRRAHALLEAAGVPMTGIAPSGHWPFLDQPDAFVVALVRFLGGL